MTTLPQPSTADDDVRPSLAIIGLGRVGTVLGRALHAVGYRIVAVAGRDAQQAQALAAQWQARAVDNLTAARSADLTLLTIPDDALGPVVSDLAAAGAWHSAQAVVHTSGALPAAVLEPAQRRGAAIGSFHPLAAFASRTMAMPAGISVAIEAQAPLRDTLWRMARAIGATPLPIEARDKPLYHAAAVIASNYTVTLAAIAAQLLQRLGATPEQSLDALLPLMRTTLDNLEQQGLPAALTGPLVRGDLGTLERHLQALERVAPAIATFYRCLAHGTLPLAQARGLSSERVGAIRDALTLPAELLRDSRSEEPF
ncbi:Rossmann-like and DUF2520 domain-containing protein [Kallotenue papyrolyticum]|uniref:Rossmann-like and DUF2520 domain-containing protein n=1 Tax=Kallotenue papyrolyticum TaxID=1325125 RepID=UPI00047856A4|nr:Rossmann-like and DUF2520 domain-containing protein [Kallotenue papyrolyticum]